MAYGSSATPLQLPFFPLIAKNLQLKFFIVYHLSAQDRAIAVRRSHECWNGGCSSTTLRHGCRWMRSLRPMSWSRKGHWLEK